MTIMKNLMAAGIVAGRVTAGNHSERGCFSQPFFTTSLITENLLTREPPELSF